MYWKTCCCFFFSILAIHLAAQPTNIQQAVLSVERIWDRAGHSAFTDLTYFRGKWYCTFREASGHIPGINGSIRVIASEDGQNWYSVALLSERGIDLRDPKLSISPDKRLMLNIGAAYYEGRTAKKRESWVAFSDKKGRHFKAFQKISFPASMTTNNDWLWRVSWHEGTAYGMIYQPREEEWDLRLVSSKDGVHYDLITQAEITGKPSEATLRFDETGRMIALVRRDGGDKIGRIGTSLPPYTTWTWNALEARLGGPDFRILPSSGSLIAATRDYTGSERTTSLAVMDTDGSFTSLLSLPSKGDTSYPGMVVKDGVIHVSYYASHEEKTAIYLARISVAGLEKIIAP